MTNRYKVDISHYHRLNQTGLHHVNVWRLFNGFISMTAASQFEKLDSRPLLRQSRNVEDLP